MSLLHQIGMIASAVRSVSSCCRIQRMRPPLRCLIQMMPAANHGRHRHRTYRGLSTCRVACARSSSSHCPARLPKHAFSSAASASASASSSSSAFYASALLQNHASHQTHDSCMSAVEDDSRFFVRNLVCIGGGAMGSMISSAVCAVRPAHVERVIVLSPFAAAAIQDQGGVYLDGHLISGVIGVTDSMAACRNLVSGSASFPSFAGSAAHDDDDHHHHHHSLLEALIIIAVKGGVATRRAGEQAIELLEHIYNSYDGSTSDSSPRTAVLTMQNGFSHVDVLRTMIERTGPRVPVLVGSTSHGAKLQQAGSVLHTGNGPTYLMDAEMSKSDEPLGSPALQMTGQLLTAAKIPPTLLPAAATDSVLWRKLIVNASLNPLTALLRCRNGVLEQAPEDGPTRRLLSNAAREVLEVAEARGTDLDAFQAGCTRVSAGNSVGSPKPSSTDGGSHNALDLPIRVAQATSANISSMLADVLRGATTEAADIIGVVVREGSRLGVATPTLNVLFDLMMALDETRDLRREIP